MAPELCSRVGRFDPLGKRLASLALILFTIPWIASCGGDHAARAVADAEAFLEARIGAPGASFEEYYSSTFPTPGMEDHWEQILTLVRNAHGPLRSYSVSVRQVSRAVSLEPKTATSVLLSVDATYHTGKGRETLLMHRDEPEGAFLIQSHYFASDLLDEAAALSRSPRTS